MNDYIVSARKYRPESFDSLIGQDNIARTLKNSISRSQLAHAYLFCGPRGVGKTTTARIFAKMINCSNPTPSGDPCGECESCRSFAEGRSYCIFELDAASNNGVDDIKELIDKVRIPPQVGKYSVYIIDEVHMLSTAAFNAFLKTLEEPPEYAIFILATTEKHKILPTILSRCQTYDFNRITVDNIVKNLRTIAAKENITVDDESLHVIALKADGAMRDALTIFDQTVAFCGTDVKYADVIRNLNVLDYEYSFGLVDNFLAGDYASALRTFDEILSKGFNALHFVSALSSHLRDLMVARCGAVDSLLELPDSLKARYREQGSRCGEKFIYDALGLTTSCEQGYRMAVNQRLHIEFTLMRLSFLTKAPAAASAQKSPEGPQPAVGGMSEAKVVAPPSPAGSGLSIASIQKNEQAKKENVEVKPVSDDIPSDDLIKEKWNELSELCKANQRQYSAFKSAKLTITEQDGKKVVTYAVLNESLRAWLDERNSRVEAKLRELVGSRKLDLVVDVQIEDPSLKVAVSAEDKSKEMLQGNPAVSQMITDLGLELK